MKIRKYLSMVVIVVTGLLSTSCLLPGMIPLTAATPGPMPVMEKDPDKVLDVLNGNDFVRLGALVEEQYTEEDFAKPGTLTFTAKVADDKPVYFNYGWCAVDEQTLQQNFEHIQVGLFFNGEQLERDAVHSLSFTSADKLVCADFGALLSDWPAGTYELKTVARFDEKINDGIADYEAGDYIQKYTVDVQP